MLHWTSHGLNTRVLFPLSLFIFQPCRRNCFNDYHYKDHRIFLFLLLLLFSFGYYLRENISHKIRVEKENWMHLLHFSLHSQLITVKLKLKLKKNTMPRQYTEKEKIAPQQSCNLYTINIFMFSPCFCFFSFLTVEFCCSLPMNLVHARIGLPTFLSSWFSSCMVTIVLFFFI